MSQGSDRPGTFLFLHLMKTGGTSFLAQLGENFPEGTMYPDPRTDPLRTYDGLEYGSLARLRALTAEDRARIRVYTGHFPYLATEIVHPDITLTVLRDPVDRALSVLRQVQAADGPRPRPLEEIYEHDWSRWTTIQDYQSRQFALTAEELEATGALIDAHYPANDRPAADIAHFVYVAMDDTRLARALANLEAVDVVGLQSDFDGFLYELWERFRWRLPTWHRRRVAADEEPVPEALRRRITDDNAYDVAFHEAALDLVARRAARRAPGV